jgi:hypothetical protein
LQAGNAQAGLVCEVGMLGCLLGDVAGHPELPDVAEHGEAAPARHVAAVGVAELLVLGGASLPEGRVLDRRGDEVPFRWADGAAFEVEQDDVAVAGRDDVAGPGVAVDDARGRGGADRGPFLLKIGEPGREPGPVASGQGG